MPNVSRRHEVIVNVFHRHEYGAVRTDFTRGAEAYDFQRYDDFAASGQQNAPTERTPGNHRAPQMC